MRIKSDFVTNSSSTSYTLLGQCLINCDNVEENIEFGEEQEESYNSYTFKADKIKNNILIENTLAQGEESFLCKECVVFAKCTLWQDLDACKNLYVNTGNNIKVIENIFNKFIRKYPTNIKISNNSSVYFKQTINCYGDGWDGGDYQSFATYVGILFKGDSSKAKKRFNFEKEFIFKKKDSLFKIKYPKRLDRLGN